MCFDCFEPISSGMITIFQRNLKTKVINDDIIDIPEVHLYHMIRAWF